MTISNVRSSVSARLLTVGLATLSGLMLVQTAAEAATFYTTTATGDQEPTPVVTNATGTGTFVLNDAGTALSYSIMVSGLNFIPRAACSPTTPGCAAPTNQDEVTIMHFHNQIAGVNGPVVFDFIRGNGTAADPDRVITAISSTQALITGVINAGVDPFTTAISPFTGAALDFNSFIAQLNAGNIYLNIHSVEFPGGEIRGQVVPEPVSTLGFLALGALGVGLKLKGRLKPTVRSLTR